MRYTCLKTIVTKVFDEILKDNDDIQRVLGLLQEKEITCSMQIKSGPIHDSVRILEITDISIIWRLIQGGSSLKKTSNISDITAITVNIDVEAMVTLKPKPSRWSTLDTSDI